MSRRKLDIARGAPLAYLNQLSLCMDFARAVLERELTIAEVIELHQALLHHRCWLV